MGGEADLINVGFPRRLGRSPRGRGSPLLDRTEIAGRGSIPAWAEKPHGGRRDEIASRVDPRVGGEATAIVPTVSTKEGRSPRGRGSLEQPIAAAEDKGSIPAWAGKPVSALAGPAGIGGDPRVGGEARGAAQARLQEGGRSPRGRGSLTASATALVNPGSIPAWAGKPTQSTRTCSDTRVDPRVGGEALRRLSRMSRERGRSPRGRGSLDASTLPGVDFRSIPAWAGKPVGAARRPPSTAVDPRVGGEAGCF